MPSDVHYYYDIFVYILGIGKFYMFAYCQSPDKNDYT